MESPWLVAVLGIGLALLGALLAILLAKVAALAARRRPTGRAPVEAGDDWHARSSASSASFAPNLPRPEANRPRRAKTAREELASSLGEFARTLHQQLSTLTQSNEQRLEAVRATVEQRLELLRSDNAQKLEQMRATVDEKLHAALEHRLGESFKLVSDRLEQVHKGLGEMQTLATGVGDLKRVLTNVKTRGGWGEVQLGALLAEVLAPGQYARTSRRDPARRSASSTRSSFPGRGEDGTPCWLPIDAKFPLEDYQRLQDAIERADVAAVELSRKALEDFFKTEATEDPRQVRRAAAHDRLRDPVRADRGPLRRSRSRRPGLADTLQRDFRVMLAGPIEPACVSQQPAAGFPHAGDRAAIDRGVARARRGQDRVRQVRRTARQDQGPARRGGQDARRGRAEELDHRAQAARRRGAAGSGGRSPADRRRGHGLRLGGRNRAAARPTAGRADEPIPAA